MNLEKDFIITLEDGNEYYVISTIIYDNEKYAYLMNMKKDNDYIIAKEIKNVNGVQVQAIADKDLIQKIALYFEKDMVEG